MDKKELNDYLKELLDSKVNKERKIVAYTGCKTYGFINIMENSCSDPECSSCSVFNQGVKEYAENWADETLKKNGQ